MLNEKLTFGDMTFPILEEKYAIRSGRAIPLFPEVKEVQPSQILVANLRRVKKGKLVNERAKAYRLIDPVIAELEELRETITSLPEIRLQVKDMEGLCGNPDFVISAGGPVKLVPVLTIVEAKKDNLDAGLAPCTAEMYAAHLLNGGKPAIVHGCVTTGTDWQFLRLDATRKIVHVDQDICLISELPRLLGILCHIVDAALVEVKDLLPPE